PDGSLFAADINDDRVYRIDPQTGKVGGVAKVGYRPCAMAMSPDNKTLAVANWGGASVSLLDPESMNEKMKIVVGSHPADLLWRNDGRLFVACAGTNSVSVIDTATDAPKVSEVIR